MPTALASKVRHQLLFKGVGISHDDRVSRESKHSHQDIVAQSDQDLPFWRADLEGILGVFDPEESMLLKSRVCMRACVCGVGGD